MREVRVNGASDHLAVVGSELSSHVREGNQLSWADEGEIEWVEEEDEICQLCGAIR